jgi:hypothetical protein
MIVKRFNHFSFFKGCCPNATRDYHQLFFIFGGRSRKLKIAVKKIERLGFLNLAFTIWIKKLQEAASTQKSGILGF